MAAIVCKNIFWIRRKAGVVATKHYYRTNRSMYPRLLIIKTDFNLKFAFRIDVVTSRLCNKNQIKKGRFEMYQITLISNKDASFHSKLSYLRLKTEINPF